MRSVTSSGLLREVRAVVFALVCLSLSAALHSWAHGELPALTALVAGAGLSLGVGVLLANRRRGLLPIGLVLGAVQVVLHGVFTLVGASGEHMMMPAHSASAMLGAHVAAGALTAAWLSAGEKATWRLVRWLAVRVPVLRAVFALVIPDAPRVTWARLAERRVPMPRLVWVRSVVRRGPPRILAVAS